MTPTMLHELRLAAGFYTVPCDGCKLCCQGDAIRILTEREARSISPGIVRVWRRGRELLRVNPA